MMLKDNSYNNFIVKMDCQLSFFLNIPHRTKGLQCLEVYLCQPEHTSCKDTLLHWVNCLLSCFYNIPINNLAYETVLIIKILSKESNKFNS